MRKRQVEMETMSLMHRRRKMRSALATTKPIKEMEVAATGHTSG